MVEGLIVVDAGGRIRVANRAAASLFGFEPPAVGKTILEATRHHEVAAVVGRLERELEVLGHEMRIDSMESPRFLQVNALALRDAAGTADGAIVVFHDLTRLRQLEGVRQEFVANVSHELRTPLSLIKSAVETLIEGGKDDPAALSRFLQIIDKHANRLALLIDDLLLLSTLDSGGLRLNKQPLPFRTTVQDAIDDLQARARARDVTLVNSVPGALVAVVDSERIRQVVSNLMDNAIKYGRPGGKATVGGRHSPERPSRGDGCRRRPRDPEGIPGEDIRALLPGGQGALEGAGRHGPRPRDSKARGPGARRRRPARERAGSRVHVHLHAASAVPNRPDGRPVRTSGISRRRRPRTVL